jgi:hypothetical protein
MNHLNAATRPKAVFKYSGSDSCFCIWSGSGGDKVWASNGCTGQIVTGTENIGNEIPNSYQFEQNYPNPFNPTTNIKFNIPKSGFVKLVVYDISGKEAAVLVNEHLTAGSYNVDFEASNFSSGVYFYKIVTEGFTDVKKMVLIK